VFGVVTAETMVAEAPVTETPSMAAPEAAAAGATPEAATERWIAELRGLMWQYAGLLRDGDGLREAQRRLDALIVTMPRGLFRRALEARNLHTVAELVVASALGREESRGAHYRNDFPLHGGVARHSVMQQGRLDFVA
jgi:L-aspartate oxidase